MEIVPLRLHVEEAVLEDLRGRLSRARWPQELRDAAGLGESVEQMRPLVDYWRTGFDWRAVEAQVNAWPNFRARVSGLRIHFLHARGRGPAPFPLVVTHGWPGSFLEMLIPADGARFTSLTNTAPVPLT